jgi:hypothetical protein
MVSYFSYIKNNVKAYRRIIGKELVLHVCILINTAVKVIIAYFYAGMPETFVSVDIHMYSEDHAFFAYDIICTYIRSVKRMRSWFLFEFVSSKVYFSAIFLILQFSALRPYTYAIFVRF